MNEIEQLEKRWKRYRFKKKIKLFFIIAILISILLYLIIGFNKIKINQNINNNLKNVSIINSNDIKKEKSMIRAENIEMFYTNGFIYELELTSIDEAQNQTATVTIDTTETIKDKADTAKPKQKRAKRSLSLEVVDSDNLTIEKIVDRYNSSKSIDDAIYIARYYYDSGDYEQAINWAIEANELDSELEESIVIFAKSKFKLGEKDDAILALKTYLSEYNSAQVKELLTLIENDLLAD